MKQADVVLLGFPLQLDMSADVRENDLVLYENITNPDGPAMTWSMFAIGYGRVEYFQVLCYVNKAGIRC